MPAIISTAAAVCQDCYKCLRECPAKAIRVRDGAAQVVDDLCIKCGHCVTACPAGAKQVRDDVPLVQELLASETPVWCSIAPSWVGEFPEIDAARLCTALRALGFAGVSETALGAQEVSAHTAALLAAEPDQLWLSSACPSAVAWATRYADCGAAVTPLLSPLLTHALMLRRLLEQPITVVFVGPCIAKKMEADKRPDLVDAVIGFTELTTMLETAGIDMTAPAADDAGFWPEQASDGALYPVEGGMLAGIRAGCGVAEAELAAVAGLPALREALADPAALQGLRFLELLACPGGCIGGPCKRHDQGSLGKRRRIIAAAPPAGDIPRVPHVDIHMDWSAEPVPLQQHDDAAIARALAQVGKYRQEDELNCGGCGYESCRAFAAALLEGHAETAMCIGHMRRLAQNKATAMMRAMPSAALLVNDGLRVVEANPALLRLVPDAADMWRVNDGLVDVRLDRLLPDLTTPLRHLLEGGESPVTKDLTMGGRRVALVAFVIEPGRLVAAILRDITEPWVQRDEIVRRAQLVIDKQLATVQQIACLLGENAAESEVILSSVIDAFGGQSGAD